MNLQPQRKPEPTKIRALPRATANIPYSTEAEEAVIGCVLTNGETVIQASFLMPEMFRNRHLAQLWQGIRALSEREERIDIITLANEMQGQDWLEQRGGLAYLTQLMAETPTSVHIEAYARIVQRAYYRRQIMALSDKLKQAAADGSQPLEAIRSELERAEEILENLEPDEIQHISVLTSRHMDMTEEAIANPYKVGIQSAWPKFNAITGGLQRRRVSVIAARSHHGKTSTMLSLALDCALSGNAVCIFNVADGDEIDVMNRLVSMLAGVPLSAITTAKLDYYQHSQYTTACGQLHDLNLFIRNGKGMSPGQIYADAKKIKQRRGLDLVVIDYLQTMRLSNARLSTYEMLKTISASLPKLADEQHLNCHIMVGAQLHRRVLTKKDNRPDDGDILGCPDLYHDCDVMVYVKRPHLFDPMKSANIMDVRIGKNKQTGRLDNLQLRFDTASTRVTEWADYDLG